MAHTPNGYSPVEMEAGTASSTRSGSTKDRMDQSAALLRFGVDEEQMRSTRMGKNSSAVAKQMCEKMHKDLFRLFLLEADEAERIEVLGNKTKKLEEEHEVTQAEIRDIKERLKAMEDDSESAIKIKLEILRDIEARIRELEYEREDTWRNCKKKVHEIELDIQDNEHRALSIRKEIHYLEQSMNGDAYPGPYHLKFVEEETFQLAAAGVICSNLLVMFMQATNPDLDVKHLNMCFLAFYVVELSLHVLYKRGKYFFGDIQIVWWNWMDTLIVVSGVAEFLIGLMGGADQSWLSGLRILRLCRLARIMKIIKIVLVSDLSWAESHYFQTFMMGVIGFNTLLMGFETEYPDCSFWPYLENVLLAIYSFELLIRMKLKGCKFLSGNLNDPEQDYSEVVWNWLDLVIVLGGVIDMWVMPGVTAVQRVMGMDSQTSNKLGQVMTLLRMARLARILRLAKLIKNIPPLYTLVIGIAKAMQGMVWVMVLTVVVLYICALVGVKLIGKGWVLPHSLSESQMEEVKSTFSDIPEAIFNLFKAMNADLGGVEPLLNYVPATRYLAMAFMVVTNWAIFSILTAVVSDNMAKVTEAHESEIAEVFEAEKRELREAKLQLLFKRLDLNHDEQLTREEFNTLMSDAAECAEMCYITGLEQSDLLDLFDLLAKRHGNDEEDTIRHHEFITLLNKECSQVTSRSMMKLEKRLQNLEELLRDGKDRALPAASQRRSGRANTAQLPRSTCAT